MEPSKGTWQPRPVLGGVASQVMTDAPMNGFIGALVMPYFDVAENAGLYPVIPAKALFNVPDVERGPKGEYPRSVEQFESGQFITGEHGLEMPTDDRFSNIYRTMLDLEMYTTRMCMAKILRAQEVRIAAKVMNTSNYQSSAANAAWDVASTDIKKDIDAGTATMRAKGMQPNALIVSYATYKNITKNALVLAAAKDMFPDASKTGTVTQAMIEAYLEIPQIIVAASMKNTANKNKAATLADIWPDTMAMLARVAAPGDDITEPCIGRIMRWNEGAGGEVITETYRDEKVRGSVVRNRHDTAETLLQSIDEDTQAVKSKISYYAGLIFTGIKTS